MPQPASPQEVVVSRPPVTPPLITSLMIVTSPHPNPLTLCPQKSGSKLPSPSHFVPKPTTSSPMMPFPPTPGLETLGSPQMARQSSLLPIDRVRVA
jgi:hypothetical protein